MKELTIEEKAKRYNETIKNLRDFYRDYDIVSSLIDVKEELANLIPELKESEDKDERIRKEMIFYFTEEIPQCSIQEHADKMKEFIAWLEKQGTSYTKKDVDDAYVEGIAFAKDELKKQYEANYQIRKDIATFIFNYKGDIKDRAKWIDYLGIKVSFAEDQGEQKPADKVEAKFKVEKGKWYVCTNSFVSRGKIIAIKGQTYQSQQEDDTITCEDNCLFIDKHDGKASDYFRLWTINDAKDGDVLSIKRYQLPFIYRGFTDINHPKAPVAHCGINCYNEFTKQRCDENWFWTGDEVEPATKEQRDLLFKKIKKAGYEWNAEKKELKEIEQKFNIGDEIKTANEEPLTITKIDEKGYWSEDLFICGFDAAARWELVGQKIAWNREDEQNFNAALGYIDDEYLRRWLKDTIYNRYENPSEWSEEDEKRLDDVTKAVNHLLLENDPWLYHENIYLEDCPVWLKSLKERVQSQPKQEWSEEDNKRLQRIIDFLWHNRKGDTDTIYQQEQDIAWLKSLRLQKCWKPTQEQMKHLAACIEESGGNLVLDSLYEQLKQLYYDTSRKN